MSNFADAFSEFAGRFVSETPIQLWAWAFSIGLLLELLLRPAEQGHSWRGYGANLAHAAVYLAILFWFAPGVYAFAGYLRGTMPFGPLVDLDLVSTETLIGQMSIGLLSLFVGDFFIYWWHRAQHSLPVLWDQHVVHHSPRELNIGAAFRVHWTEFMLQAVFVITPLMVLFKITPNAMGVIGTALGIWVYLIHTNVRLHLGPFARVIAGPQQHRIHHSTLSEHRNKNFAAYFPVWDIVFGTYYHPHRYEYPPTGVAGVSIDDTVTMSIFPFRAWAERLASVIRACRVG